MTPQESIMTSSILRLCSTDLITPWQRGCFRGVGGCCFGGGTAQPCLSTPRTTTRGPFQQQQPWRSDLHPPQAPGFYWSASQPWNSPMTFCLWHLGFPPKHTTNTKNHIKTQPSFLKLWFKRYRCHEATWSTVSVSPLEKLSLRYSWIYYKNLTNEVQYIITSYISL